MTVHGREVHFLRTVGASIKIIEELAGGDPDKLASIFKGGYTQTQTATAKFIAYLSEGYENSKSFEEEGYEPRPLTKDEALAMDDALFGEAFDEALKAWMGEKASVETEPPKKKEKPARSS